MTGIDQFVVDASVGIKLFVNEQGSEKAFNLFKRLSDDPPIDLYVPDLFYIECTNILLKYVRRFGRSTKNSQADLADLSKLTLRAIPTIVLMEDAFKLAFKKNLTAYDACYAVLARRLKIPLITADEPMAQAVKWAVLLGDIE